MAKRGIAEVGRMVPPAIYCILTDFDNRSRQVDLPYVSPPPSVIVVETGSAMRFYMHCGEYRAGNPEDGRQASMRTLMYKECTGTIQPA